MRYRPGPKLMMVARSVALPWSALWALANRQGWLPEYEVGISPFLDPAALERWREALNASSLYLEYGSGGSTVEAVRSGKPVISVESDGRYLQAVEQKVAEVSGPVDSFHPLHADIGTTEKWGRPLIPWPTSNRVAKWRTYTAAPWQLLDRMKAVPDFIFIDGRFRAACVLESFLRLPDETDCQFILDDFAFRKHHYAAALAFATDVQPVGRAVAFRRDPKFDRSAGQTLLAKCQANPE